ncbi:mannosyltransferase family protein [Streptomyces polyrhachis]|uniref:Mannosyltransferase family protein n=1 Tax=Streptomyces polyrhachis TaxID=1282885 RepID=A0ABW2GA35_9ACTN
MSEAVLPLRTASGPGPEAAPRAPRPFAARLRAAAPALLGYAAIRALGLLVLALWSASPAKDLRVLLSQRWDALWYVRVVEHGYDFTLRAPDGRILSDLAFFPLLPALESALSRLTALTPGDAGLLVSALASLAAAAGLYAVGELLHGRRAGIALALLWGALPVAVVQSMAYSESLFTALAVWSLYALLTGRWIGAGVLCALAGLTRPIGVAVVAAIWLTGLLALRDGTGRRARVLAGLALAPLGWLGYLLWVGVRTGGPTGYFGVQAAWGNGFDAGLTFARFIGARFTAPGAGPLAGLALCAGLALPAWAFTLCVRARQPLALLVYAAVVVALALGASGYIGSKPRLLLPAFPLLLPAAVALARARTARAAAVLAGLAAASVLYGAVWLTGSGPP